MEPPISIIGVPDYGLNIQTVREWYVNYFTSSTQSQKTFSTNLGCRATSRWQPQVLGYPRYPQHILGSRDRRKTSSFRQCSRSQPAANAPLTARVRRLFSAPHNKRRNRRLPYRGRSISTYSPAQQSA